MTKLYSILLVLIGALIAAPAALAQPLQLPHAWADGVELTTEHFESTGPFEIMLGAWCHRGFSYVEAIVFSEDGEQVGSVRVDGEGVQTRTIEVGPGVYYIEVSSPTMADYTGWEVLLEPLAATTPPEAAQPEQPEDPADAGGVSESIPAVPTEPLSGVVEIVMRTDGADNYFTPAGVWVTPGTTIRFVLESGVHDSRAYHPTNGIEFSRIPENAEPWDTGMLGGLINPASTVDVVLTVEGVYDYFCLPHHSLGMVGRIVVGDPDASPARDLQEIPIEAAREALPSVERILEDYVVPRGTQ